MRGMSSLKGLNEYASFIVWSLKQSDKFFLWKERKEGRKEKGMEGWKKGREIETQRDAEREETDWVGAEVRVCVELSSWPQIKRVARRREGRGKGSYWASLLRRSRSPLGSWNEPHMLCSQSSHCPAQFDTSSVFFLLQHPAQPLSFRASRGKPEWNEIHFTENVLHRKCSDHLVFTYLALATLCRELRDRARICNPALPLTVWVIWGKLLNFSGLWFPSS